MHLRTLVAGIPGAFTKEVFDRCRSIVSAFTEPGSGLEVELGKWYVLSDSGSSYTPLGFTSVAAALDWWAVEGKEQFDGCAEIEVPVFLGGVNGWDRSGSPQVFKADDLLDFWGTQENLDILVSENKTRSR